jgi:hypothetical protein
VTPELHLDRVYERFFEYELDILAVRQGDGGPRPDWWPPYLDWPPKPSPPPEILYPPPTYTWPRLPVDHPYYLPPGYSWPNNLPPGHPGHNVPQPPKPIQA